MKITELKPNHICRNPNCKKGTNGEPKHYYACDYCNRSRNWRSLYCCVECFKEAEENKEVLPKRTDMTEEAVKELLSSPLEEVKKKTMEDLADYKDYIEENGLAKTIDYINDELDKANIHE